MVCMFDLACFFLSLSFKNMFTCMKHIHVAGGVSHDSTVNGQYTHTYVYMYIHVVVAVPSTHLCTHMHICGKIRLARETIYMYMYMYVALHKVDVHVVHVFILLYVPSAIFPPMLEGKYFSSQDSCST